MNNIGRIFKEYFDLSIATLLIAIAVVFYMEPCHIITGSVSGLGILLADLYHLDPSLLILILNLVCYLLGLLVLGKDFGIRSLYVSVLLPLLVKMLGKLSLDLYTGITLIDTALFLLFLTAGQTIMFRLGCSSGGLDTIADVIARLTDSPTGRYIALCGILVSVLTIKVYGVSAGLNGVLVTMINGLLIDVFMDLKAITIRIFHLKTSR